MAWPKSIMLVISGLLCVSVAFGAQTNDDQTERIRAFDSRIVLNPDGTMQVRETIEVQAEGQQVIHGIYRDFPTKYQDKFGNLAKVAFEITGVARDGNPEPYHTENIDNGVRIYFGDANTVISTGIHRYIFTYNTSRQLGFFKDHDELFWNVTGFGWTFSIDVTTATVILPPQIRSAETRVYAYTSELFGPGIEAESGRDPDGNPRFRTDNLAPFRGFRILVTWPKGLIAEPARAQKIKWFLSDNRQAEVGLLGLLLMLGYYLVVWLKVGRDPDPGTIVPSYEPPNNMSPAAMRYLVQMKFDDKTFASAILGLAAKGYLTINNEHSREFDLTSSKDRQQDNLSSDEKALTQKLFERRRTVSLSGLDYSVVSRARDALATALHTGLEKTYFVTNANYLWTGVVLTAITIAAMELVVRGQTASGQLGAAIFSVVFLSFWSLIVSALLHATARAWKKVGSHKVRGGAGAIVITLFTALLMICEIGILMSLAWRLTPIVLGTILLLIGINVLFHYLLKAPTRAGRQLLDQVEGFKMFLTAVDGENLKSMTGPGKMPAIFDRFLPYAVALGVEQAWAKQFSGLLAGAAQASNYSPSWYKGALVATTPLAFATSFDSGFSTAISSSYSRPPGSSSGVAAGGFSGGGFSGGGGGGGAGGGGW